MLLKDLHLHIKNIILFFVVIAKEGRTNWIIHTESPIQAAIQTSQILLQVANNKPQLAQCYHFF